ncbi:MAG: 4-alpha-glucanotransferase, partial [Clostridium sp.]|nr:4-alpha-glucanotransferase [Clostridium sp.]
MRKCGVLLPIFSIPSHYGIGSFSRQAYEFVDFLEQAGQKLWQILPLGPTSYGDSPYQSFSTFAGNPYYIDLETLVADGYLEREECDEADFGNRKDSIDYARLYRSRFAVLKKAYQRALEKGIEQRPEYREFLSKNAYWLEDYALYMAVKSHFQGNGWELWEKGIRLREKESLEQYAASQKEEIGFFRFLQYLFSAQWKALKAYANGKGIEIIGDIPIYVAFDSADTWANPRLFLLDEECRPTGVAGCPPDAFSATGQLWGNPLYDWGYHRKTGYEWWRKRITYCYELYDIVRIDHFR